MTAPTGGNEKSNLRRCWPNETAGGVRRWQPIFTVAMFLPRSEKLDHQLGAGHVVRTIAFSTSPPDCPDLKLGPGIG